MWKWRDGRKRGLPSSRGEFFPLFLFNLLRPRHAHINPYLFSYRIKMRKAARRGVPYSHLLETDPQIAQAYDFEFEFGGGLQVAHEEEDEEEAEAVERVE